MFKITTRITRLVLAILVLGIGLAAFPTSVSASRTYDPIPPENHTLSDTMLEKIWARELTIYERQDNLLERGDALIKRAQTLIDKASEAGMNVTAAQVALEVFEDALRDAHVAHQQLNGIVNSHQGFNAEGELIDRTKAIETVKEMGQGLREFRSIVKEPIKELLKALRALRATIKETITPNL